MGELKDHIYQTIHKNRKPLKLIAYEMDICESYLTKHALPDPEERKTGSGCNFPLKRLVDLIKCTGNYEILDHIEEDLGRVGIFLPPPEMSDRRIYKQAMQTVKEFGQMMSKLDEHMVDGELTGQEIEEITNEGNGAVQAIVTLLHGLKAGKGE